MKKYPYTYIAAPFFNTEQLKTVEDIKVICEAKGHGYFSPKDECMFTPGVTTPDEVLDINIKALENNVQLVICVTDGMDPGTLFEAGWAYANRIPIIYIWQSGAPTQKFNLVLAASGSVCRNLGQLEEALDDIYETGTFNRRNWGEDMSYE